MDPVEKARKRLVKAQADLQKAQVDRARVKLEGEQTLERTRQRVADNLSRATLRVEERSGVLEQAQLRLAELRSPPHAEQPAAEKNLRVMAPAGEAETGRTE